MLLLYFFLTTTVAVPMLVFVPVLIVAILPAVAISMYLVTRRLSSMSYYRSFNGRELMRHVLSKLSTRSQGYRCLC